MPRLRSLPKIDHSMRPGGLRTRGGSFSGRFKRFTRSRASATQRIEQNRLTVARVVRNGARQCSQ